MIGLLFSKSVGLWSEISVLGLGFKSYLGLF